MHCTAQRDGDHITQRRDRRACLETMRGVNLLYWNLMRRVLIFGLAFSVFAAGLMPLSACALLSSKKAECAEPTAQSPCDQMHPHSAGTQLSTGSDKSCCVTSQAPLPELQFKGVEAGPSVTMAVPLYTLAIPSLRPYSTLLVVENPSPPSFQSLLCTFLI
jgi:hypothetical protein